MGHNLGIMTHKILLLGANGQVGHALQTTLKPLGEVVYCTRAELDLSTLSTQPTALAELGAAGQTHHHRQCLRLHRSGPGRG